MGLRSIVFIFVLMGASLPAFSKYVHCADASYENIVILFADETVRPVVYRVQKLQVNSIVVYTHTFGIDVAEINNGAVPGLGSYLIEASDTQGSFDLTERGHDVDLTCRESSTYPEI